MLFWKKRKEEEPYTPAFDKGTADVTEEIHEENTEGSFAEEAFDEDALDEDMLDEEEDLSDEEGLDEEDAADADGDLPETVTLDDGRVFPREFVEEIRSYEAADLKTILEEQEAYYSADEFAYIEEVFRERLGDIH